MTAHDDLLRDHPGVPEAVRAYITGLETGDFESAAKAFSAPCLYSRDLGPSGAGRVELTDPESILAFFRERGRQPWLHHCDTVAVAGARHLVEGWVSDGAGQLLGSFCVSFEAGEDGKLRRAVAYSASPPVGTVAGPTNYR